MPHRTARAARLAARLPAPVAAMLAALLLAPLAACDRSPARQAEAAQPQRPQAQEGEASFYANRFAGRRMANGEPFNPRGENAAHRDLPLGTRAEVVNLENGRRTTVTVTDRGPYARGRIIDLSPATAEHLGMKEEGTARVEVRPLAER